MGEIATWSAVKTKVGFGIVAAEGELAQVFEVFLLRVAQRIGSRRGGGEVFAGTLAGNGEGNRRQNGSNGNNQACHRFVFLRQK